MKIHKWPVGNGESVLTFPSLIHLGPAPFMTVVVILCLSFIPSPFFTQQWSFSFASFDLSTNKY